MGRARSGPRCAALLCCVRAPARRHPLPLPCPLNAHGCGGLWGCCCCCCRCYTVLGHVDLATAAAVPVVYGTADVALRHRAQLQPGGCGVRACVSYCVCVCVTLCVWCAHARVLLARCASRRLPGCARHSPVP